MAKMMVVVNMRMAKKKNSIACNVGLDKWMDGQTDGWMYG